MMKSLRLGLLAALLLTFAIGAKGSGVHELEIGGVELRVELDGGIQAGEHGRPWTEWLANALRATSTVTGSFPREGVVIKLRSTARSTSPIAFGQVRRSHPPQLRFYVSPDASLDGLNGDWRGYHEFAHLLIPFPGNDDIWFTEGLASYYQYLLQSRAGVIPEREAWRELLDGFGRGETDRNGRGRTLRSLSPDMWQARAQKRVYWTGAAFFLRVDIRLRTESGGKHSLDKALAAFHECCMQSRRRWNAIQLVEALGDVSVAEIWRQEYQRTISAPAEPRYGDALERLGIRRYRSDQLFDEDESSRALRRAIAGARPSPAAFGLIVGNEPEFQERSSSAP